MSYRLRHRIHRGPSEFHHFRIPLRIVPILYFPFCSRSFSIFYPLAVFFLREASFHQHRFYCHDHGETHRGDLRTVFAICFLTNSQFCWHGALRRGGRAPSTRDVGVTTSTTPQEGRLPNAAVMNDDRFLLEDVDKDLSDVISTSCCSRHAASSPPTVRSRSWRTRTSACSRRALSTWWQPRQRPLLPALIALRHARDTAPDGRRSYLSSQPSRR